MELNSSRIIVMGSNDMGIKLH